MREQERERLQERTKKMTYPDSRKKTKQMTYPDSRKDKQMTYPDSRGAVELLQDTQWMIEECLTIT